jgi:hypothetical protein
MATGREIVEILFRDIERFFYHSSGFKIRREYDSKGAMHASIKGKYSDTRIRLSIEFCHYEVDSLDDLFYVLIILCHEVAHYLNRHNDHNDEDDIDITAIEAWADFYGSRLFMSSITFGKGIQSLMLKYCSQKDQNVILDSIGRAIRSIYDEVYIPNTDERYPPALERAFIFSSGVTSFFYRLYGELRPEWTTHVLLKLLRNSGLCDLAENHQTDWDAVSEQTARSSDIHQSLQNNEMAITVGLKPEYIPILVTNYKISETEKINSKNKLKKQIRSIGLDLDDFINERA